MRLTKSHMLDFHQKIGMSTLHEFRYLSKDFLSEVNWLNNIGQLPPELFRSFFEAETLPSKSYFDQMNHIYLAATGLEDYIELERGTHNMLMRWKVPPREIMVNILTRFFKKFDFELSAEHLHIIYDCIDGNQDKYYHVYEIPKKSGGMRTIEAPVDALKEMQRVLLDRVLYPVYGAHYSAMGFVPHRGIRKNAEEHFQREHATKQTILKIDLKDCFPSIGSDVLYSNLLTQLLIKRTRNRWTSFADLTDYTYTIKTEHNVLKEYAAVNTMPGEIFSKLYFEHMIFLLGIVYLCTLRERLPQGAPSSPALLNIALRPLDASIKKACYRAFKEQYSPTYTRYADDIIISVDTVERAVVAKHCVERTLTRFNLDINDKKVQILRHGRPQRITGVVINHKVSVSRVKRNNIRAMMHNFITGKHKISKQAFAKLRGYRAFIKSINADEWTDKFERLFNICKAMLPD